MQPIHIHPTAHRLLFTAEKPDNECKSLVPILEAKILFLSYLGYIYPSPPSPIPPGKYH